MTGQNNSDFKLVYLAFKYFCFLINRIGGIYRKKDLRIILKFYNFFKSYLLLIKFVLNLYAHITVLSFFNR